MRILNVSSWIFLFSLFLIIGDTQGFAGQVGEKRQEFKILPARSVVELFTSQGCSSCPPADILLKKYVQRDDVIALSYSVDYWDYLGWRDTFGRKENSDRQRAYARTRGDGAVYTPQVVVNGLVHMNGASKFSIENQIKKTRLTLTPKSIDLHAAKMANKVRIWAEGSFKGHQNRGDQEIVLWMVRVKDVGKVAIKRGENHGRTISYHNVVLGVEKLGVFEADGIDINVDWKKIAPTNGIHCVLLAQVGASGPVLGAIELR